MENQPLTFQELEKILRLIDATPKEGTFTIKVDEMKLSVTKGAKQAAAVVAPSPPIATAAPAPQAVAPASAVAEVAPAAQVAPVEVPAAVAPAAPATHEPAPGYPVAAPLTGVFYRQPSPDAPPFVVEGQQVNEGDVLAIIEVMKLMNRLTAPVSGVVTKIYAENEDLIEHGNTLFVIDTTGGAK